MNIKEAWLSYKAILPQDAPRTQVIETRRAFYAGVWAVLTMQLTVVGNQPDEEGVRTLAGWYKECIAFRDMVTAGAEDDV